MAVQVQGQTNQKRDLFDYVLGGLQAAANFTSIQRARAELNQIDEVKARQEKLDAQNAQAQEQAFAQNFAKVPDETPGALKLSGKEGLYLPRSTLVQQKQLELESAKTQSARGLAQQELDLKKGAQAQDFAKEFVAVPQGTSGAVALQAPGEKQAGLYLPRSAVPGAAGQLAKSLSPGEKSRDEEFAKALSEFSDRGGFSDVSGDIKELQGVSKVLGSGKSLTGPIQGLAPDFIRKGTNEEAINIREGVRKIVAKNLKLILGAQFTQQEGNALMNRAFDDSVSEEENKRRVDNLITNLQTRSNQMLRASDYFEKHGTVKGFESVKGANAAFAAQPAPAPENGDGTAQAATLQQNDPYDRFRKAPDQYKEGEVVRKEDGGLVIRRGQFWLPVGD